MSRTPVPFAPDTLESIRRAFRGASERRHDLVSLEHLLHALLEDPQAREILTRCRVDLTVLRTDLEEVLDKAFTPVPGRKSVKPESTLGFDRVVERSVVHAASSSAQQVESGALLVFLLQEEDSHAAYFLRKQGLDRLTLLRAISHPDPSQGPVIGAPDGGESRPSDPLEAYASDLVARAAAGTIDPLIGRQLELERMIQVLCRRRKNNPAARRRARRGQDGAGRRPGASHPQGRGPGRASQRARLRARHGVAGGRHPLPRRLRRAGQAGARRAGQAGSRDPLHR